MRCVGVRVVAGPAVTVVFVVDRMEVVGQYVVRGLLRDLAAVLDGGTEVDAAPDPRVAHVTLRQYDGFRVAVPYPVPNPPIPGVWIPTAASPPIRTYLGQMTPFAVESADAFRPNGPPALGSKKWARDYNEVKEIGSATSTTRTAEQTLAARFWAEPPVQQARGSFRPRPRPVTPTTTSPIDCAGSPNANSRYSP